MLKVNNAVKTFGNKKALNGISFTAEEGRGTNERRGKVDDAQGNPLTAQEETANAVLQEAGLANLTRL